VSGTDEDLESIAFTDHLNGYIVGSGGTILKTINSGGNWTIQTFHPDTIFNSVAFLDHNEGWAVGRRLSNTVMIRTLNGGQSWESIYAGTASLLASITFNNSFDGWAVGGHTTMRLQLCKGDMDEDLDVDGIDLLEIILNPTAIKVTQFARGFGLSNCPY
jgi:photosystem II stability/assembly factor-like uncharacterized protein